MSWKRILLFSLFFSILIVSLFYFVLPRILHPLRIDAIPQGAYVIPWMRPNPSIEELKTMPGIDGPPWDIDSVMADALKLNMTFRIVCQHETINETRVVPSTVYLGHDMEYLYVGGKFSGMGRNPASNTSDNPGWILPNYLEILFDVAHDGVLTFPESGSCFAVTIDEGANWRTKMGWYVVDKVWSDYVSEINRAAWVLAVDVSMHVWTWGLADVQYDNSTGTLVFIFSRYLWKPGYYMNNALQMRPGERWVMGFLLELGYATWYGAYSDFVDGWPQKTYPYLSNNCSWWPKLCIDFSNPPTQYPGGPSIPLANPDTSNQQNQTHTQTTPAYTTNFTTTHHNTKHQNDKK